MKIKPLPAHLLVSPLPDPKPAGGIILDVKTVRSINPYCKALVRDKGSPTRNYPMTEFIRDGQEIVLMPRSAGTAITIDGIPNRIVHVSEIIGLWSTRENLEVDYAKV